MHGDTAGTTPAQTVPRDRLRPGFSTTVIALVLSLAACTGDPAPVSTPTGGGSVSSTPATPQPTRPVEEATPDSAIQFTRYFWDLYNYAYQTYDTAPLKAISDPACTFCASTISGALKTQASKSRTEGADIKVIELTSPPVKITTGTLVICVLSQAKGKTIGPDGSTTSIPAIQRIRSTMGLEWTSAGWMVHGVDYKVQS